MQIEIKLNLDTENVSDVHIKDKLIELLETLTEKLDQDED